MATPVTDPTTRPPALTRAFTYYAYDVAAVAMKCALLSSVARGQHHALSDDAWLDPRGQCRIHGSRLTIRCRKEKLDAKAICQELIDSKLWERDGDDLIAVWLLPERQRCEKKYTQAVAAANRGAALREQQRFTRGAKKPRTKRAKSKPDNALSDRSAPAEPMRRENDGMTSVACTLQKLAPDNALPDNSLSDRSADAELIEVRSTSSYEEVPRTAATTPSASRADGASGAVATDRPPRPPAQPREVPDLKAMLAEQNILAVEPPVAWMQADVPDVVDALRAAGTGVDIERALFRAFAMHQKRGLEAHQPLLEELRRGLAGADGRAGLIGVGQAAARSLALALHGTAVMEFPPAPLVLRAVAGAIDRELREHGDQGDAKRMAVRIALEFARPGGRKATGYALAHELPPVERLNGFVTKQAVLV